MTMPTTMAMATTTTTTTKITTTTTTTAMKAAKATTTNNNNKQPLLPVFQIGIVGIVLMFLPLQTVPLPS